MDQEEEEEWELFERTLHKLVSKRVIILCLSMCHSRVSICVSPCKRISYANVNRIFFRIT